MVPTRVAMVVLVVLALFLSLGEGSSVRNELANSLDANDPIEGVPINEDKDEDDDEKTCKREGDKCFRYRPHSEKNGGRYGCCPGLYCKTYEVCTYCKTYEAECVETKIRHKRYRCAVDPQAAEPV